MLCSTFSALHPSWTCSYWSLMQLSKLQQRWKWGVHSTRRQTNELSAGTPPVFKSDRMRWLFSWKLKKCHHQLLLSKPVNSCTHQHQTHKYIPWTYIYTLLGGRRHRHCSYETALGHLCSAQFQFPSSSPVCSLPWSSRHWSGWVLLFYLHYSEPRHPAMFKREWQMCVDIIYNKNKSTKTGHNLSLDIPLKCVKPVKSMLSINSS